MGSADQGPREQGYRTPPALARELALRWAGGAWDIDVTANDDGSNSCGEIYRCPAFSAFDELPWSIGLDEKGEPVELVELGLGADVWGNPPFKKLPPWVERAEHEIAEGHVDTVCLLLPVRAGQKWWTRVSSGGLWTLDWIEGRVGFINPATGEVDPNPREPVVAAICRQRLDAKVFR